jgi:WD40 repeat protein
LPEQLVPAVFVAVIAVGVLTGVYGLVSVRRVEASIGLVLCAVPLVLLWGSLPSDVLGSDTADLGVESVAFGVVDGRTVLASGSEDRTVRLWDPATGRQIGEPLTGHDEWVESVAFGTVDGRTVLASGSWDETVRLWDPATGKQIGEPLTGPPMVQSVAFGTVDGSTVLASGGWDGRMRLWDPATGKQIRRLTGESWSF